MIKNKPVITPAEVFCKNSSKTTQYVKKIILKENLIPYQCSCGLEGVWQGKPITLQLEHKNGDNRDHRLENLEFLCPNCHTQTLTYCSKNRKFRLNNQKEQLPSYKRPNRLEILFASEEKRQLLLESLENFNSFEDLFKHYNIKNNNYSVRRLNELLMKYEFEERVVVFHQTMLKNKIIKDEATRAKPRKDYPPIAELIALVQKSNLSAVSRTIGCTANGLKKHLLKHNAWPMIKEEKVKPPTP